MEQTEQGKRAAIEPLAAFDALGEGFTGRIFPGADKAEDAGGRGGIDISLAVGPNHIFEILNGNLAVFTKKGKKFDATGKLLYGAVPNNTVFAGFGVRCGVSNNADSVVRYDQLADRWLIVVPVFQRPPDNPQGPYAMCYAVSVTPDPLGPYYRYEFQRPLFPDYPRPAVWPDGYYNPTSTSDNLLPEVVTQKHDCIADRNKMLKGLPATEQCVVIDGGVFMLNADLDGKRLPPAGAPNIMMSTGGTQLMKMFEDDGIYFYKVHVDWNDPSKTTRLRAAEDRRRALSLSVRRPAEQLRLAAGHRAPPRFAGRQADSTAGVSQFRQTTNPSWPSIPWPPRRMAAACAGTSSA